MFADVRVHVEVFQAIYLTGVSPDDAYLPCI